MLNYSSKGTKWYSCVPTGSDNGNKVLLGLELGLHAPTDPEVRQLRSAGLL